MKAKQDLDHQIWKLLKKENLTQKKILVGLSGGLDSVALLASLCKVHKDVCAAHIHHGPSKSKEQQNYRDEAVLFCEAICEKLEVKLYIVKKSRASKSFSEATLRDYRYQALRQILKIEKLDLLALAHHRDDLLETRMLRLIRGTGAQGLIAMRPLRDFIVRPLLDVSKKQLGAYLKKEKLDFLEDPSNLNTDPLRNWLRRKWFVELEKKQKGSLQSLARSLETLAGEAERNSVTELLESGGHSSKWGLSRVFFLSLTRTEQKRLLAQYLLSLGKRDFSQGQLEEICKRLDNPQKMIKFKVGTSVWTVNAEQIKVDESVE